MQINELFSTYERDRNQQPESINHLLDYYQKKYIAGEIDIKHYQTIYYYLQKQGAKSAHDYGTF
ncbi:YppF family protein [Virgibacillus alimentarius]|uniref:YppF-like protein n=1 Tax=Virgibacillus alimentarius TaxID=698769 RepID=A0ABS4S9P4_9BACI|nr:MULTISPECIES: YppF family protein [Virgibacillus]MBP2258235.1 hypothetical protein [Virgibacillus alimentarius]HLR65796.1 YppF family protein [Virgibacillus sp.]